VDWGLTDTDIEHAFQALALDERRKAFRPTLWYIPHELIASDTRKTPELKQVWVCDAWRGESCWTDVLTKDSSLVFTSTAEADQTTRSQRWKAILRVSLETPQV
jgi:hypothetical protein